MPGVWFKMVGLGWIYDEVNLLSSTCVVINQTLGINPRVSIVSTWVGLTQVCFAQFECGYPNIVIDPRKC